jgi:hypothetical protein
VNVTLYCGHRGVGRRVKVYEGPVGASPRLPHSTLDLYCPHCGFAPRPGDDSFRALLELAASRPGHALDINPPPAT